MRTKEESRAIIERALAGAAVDIENQFGAGSLITKENKHEFIARNKKLREERARKIEIDRMLIQANEEIESDRDFDLRESMGYGPGRRTGG